MSDKVNKTILERKQAVVDKLNAIRQPYHHDFEVVTGKCKNCNTGSIAKLPTNRPLTNLDLMCSVITPEEVADFSDPVRDSYLGRNIKW